MDRRGLAIGIMVAVSALSLTAQAPPPATTGQQVHATLNQLMRGTLYPAANVVFSAQSDNPGDVKPIPGHDPSMATDPLTSTFGGWQAVENAALALAESANLLSIPGRTCSNGVPVPITDPAWATFTQQLRDASMEAYRAAQAKDQDKMIANSETLTAACGGCHRKWRDRATPANRCK
ncbi:MAG: cytochrome c [Acidobacteria bacterium]|nr:cytochrome c [Acidobacteriota bacterium]